ncbi:hypothetical protein [Lihuaxuella thermophila]|uniref:Glycerophosphoryl diester phosphodiesterase membrane domain-containing protein n=1 Tax=Lihuaxuella thermophila TaxID=1173111 RepID=A0A1H8FKQ4_9BACL|nr:hypothetical protein [Lihuaxuella thermophila]SEN31668.1 hypothetical protein SAMN05444955_108218 [Lihuaxuella thermophila]
MKKATTHKPLKFGELMDGTFRIYKRHFRSVWLFAFLVTSPFTLWIEWWYWQESKLNFAQTAIPAEKEIMILVVSTLIWLAVFHPLIQNACADLSREEVIGWKQLFVSSFYNIWKIMISQWLICLLWGLMFAVIVLTVGLPLYFLARLEGTDDPNLMLWMVFLISLFFFLLPGVYLYVRLSLVIPVLRTEGCSIRQSVIRSWELTRGAFWSTLGILVCLYLVSIPLAFVLVGMEELSATFYLMPDWLRNVVYLLATVLIDALLTPLIPIFFGIFYWNQRAVREAYDLVSQLRLFTGERR